MRTLLAPPPQPGPRPPPQRAPLSPAKGPPTCRSAEGPPAPEHASPEHGGGHGTEAGGERRRGGGEGRACERPAPGRPGRKMAVVLVGGSQRVVREAVRRSAVRPPAPGCWGCAPAGTAASEARGGMLGRGSGLPAGWGALRRATIPGGRCRS